VGERGGLARFGPCAAYRESLAGFTRTDVWLAVAMMIASCVDTYRWGRFYATRSSIPHREILARGFIGVAVLLAAVAVVLAARRQRWRTVGFGTAHVRRSLLVGAVIAAVMLGGSWLVGASLGYPATSPLILTYGLPYYLVMIGFFEEVVWRGFVTTRLAAAFRRPWVGVVLAGALFGLSHLVMPLAYGGADVASILIENWWRVPIPFAWHFVLWWLYARYDSLAAPTLLHLAMNLSGELL